MQKVTTAAIIGGGVIGGGWSARLLENGIDVRCFAMPKPNWMPCLPMPNRRSPA
jgi:3-hydroxyacyl-CoA dehydrogenase